MTGTIAGHNGAEHASLEQRLERWRHRGARVEWDDVIGHTAAKRELRVVTEQIRRHWSPSVSA